MTPADPCIPEKDTCATIVSSVGPKIWILPYILIISYRFRACLVTLHTFGCSRHLGQKLHWHSHSSRYLICIILPRLIVDPRSCIRFRLMVRYYLSKLAPFKRLISRLGILYFASTLGACDRLLCRSRLERALIRLRQSSGP